MNLLQVRKMPWKESSDSYHYTWPTSQQLLHIITAQKRDVAWLREHISFKSELSSKYKVMLLVAILCKCNGPLYLH